MNKYGSDILGKHLFSYTQKNDNLLIRYELLLCVH